MSCPINYCKTESPKDCLSNTVSTLIVFTTEKAMVVSLSSLMNDSVPDKVEVTKFNLPSDTLLLLELAHGPESDAVKTVWNKLQAYAKNRGNFTLV